MPEVSHRRALDVPTDRIWDFVKDMNNWAPMLTGYQSHEVKSDTESVWTLKGDVGILSRVVQLDVTITEWSGPERVSFTLDGINEMVSGGGTFQIIDQVAATPAAPVEPEARPGLFGRLVRWLFRALFQRKYGRLEALPEAAETCAELVFTARMEAGGPTGPLVNAMLGPAMAPAVEQLAEQIARHLEDTAQSSSARRRRSDSPRASSLVQARSSPRRLSSQTVSPGDSRLPWVAPPFQASHTRNPLQHRPPSTAMFPTRGGPLKSP